MLYQRAPRMFGDLALARGDGRYPRLMRALGGVKLLILDDWGLEPLGPEQRHDLLEIVDFRRAAIPQQRRLRNRQAQRLGRRQGSWHLRLDAA